MKRIPNSDTLLSSNGKPWLVNGEQQTAGSALEIFVFNYHTWADPRAGEHQTGKDSYHGWRIAERCHQPVIELEDADHEWLLGKLDVFGPRMFGITAQILINVVKGATELGGRNDQHKDESVPETAVMEEQ